MSETEIEKIIKSPEFIAASTINQTITCRFCNKKEHVKAWAPFGTLKIYLCSECLDLLERHIKHLAFEAIKKMENFHRSAKAYQAMQKLKESEYFEGFKK